MARRTGRAAPVLDRFCAPDALPFTGAYVASEDLRPVVEGFLADDEPGFIPWSDLDDAQGLSEQAETELEIAPLDVWVSSVGASH
ncbi:hypothetical protein [Streptomyces cadmiisoli]|uniref:hypothetical protein n=1 Tax=Streptomyces cadmiisoli TaxID=2184053 RepID=UPI001FE5B4E3|nr:hypothetical protein [Streptomyces cadmiisoli]